MHTLALLPTTHAWVDYLPIIMCVLYIMRVVYKARTHTPCTMCGRWMRINPDPNITECWACESKQYQ